MYLTQSQYSEVEKDFFQTNTPVTSLGKSIWSLDKTQAIDFASKKRTRRKTSFL